MISRHADLVQCGVTWHHCSDQIRRMRGQLCRSYRTNYNKNLIRKSQIDLLARKLSHPLHRPGQNHLHVHNRWCKYYSYHWLQSEEFNSIEFHRNSNELAHSCSWPKLSVDSFKLTVCKWPPPLLSPWIRNSREY